MKAGAGGAATGRRVHVVVSKSNDHASGHPPPTAHMRPLRASTTPTTVRRMKPSAEAGAGPDAVRWRQRSASGSKTDTRRGSGLPGPGKTHTSPSYATANMPAVWRGGEASP